MKITKKQLLGLLGLFLVAVITTIAAFMPPIGAAAESVTDTISIRVIDGPMVHIVYPANESVVYDSNITVQYDYDFVDAITLIELKYTDENGEEKTINLTEQYAPEIELPDGDIEKEHGRGSFPLDLSKYGYHLFTLTIKGTDNLLEGVDGIAHDEIQFTYAPHPDSGGSGTGSTTPSTPDEDQPGADDPDANIPDLDVPDTGVSTADLSVSKEDALITALSGFGLIALCAIIFVARGRKEKASAKAVAKKRD